MLTPLCSAQGLQLAVVSLPLVLYHTTACAASHSLPPTPPHLCSAMIAAGVYGSGRVLAGGHEGMLNADQTSNLGRLVRNAAKWAAGGKSTGIRIATNDDGWAGASGLLATIASQVRSRQWSACVLATSVAMHAGHALTRRAWI